jgi:hypothetical protein
MNRPVFGRIFLVTVVPPVGLFALNSFVCWKLFGTEYLRYMHSIEGAYIAISHYIVANWPDLGWFPLWYAGIPYQNTYPPLLHLAVAAFAKLSGTSPALSYHAVVAAIYCLGPVTVYWLAFRLSGTRFTGVLAGVFCSLFSPSALLIRNVREDIGSIWHIRRLHTLVFYGDGPFVSSLTLVPVAIACLDQAVKKRKPFFYFVAAIAMASVVLTNWLGGAVLGMAVFAYLVAMGKQGWFPVCLRVAATSILAYLLASPWIPPSTLRTIFKNAQTIGAVYTMTWKQVAGLIILSVTTALLGWVVGRMARAPIHIRFAACFSLYIGGITLLAEWANIYLVPQPHRYHLGMEMAICLLAAFLLGPLLQKNTLRNRVLIAGFIVICVFQALHARKFADRLIGPIDIRSTTEYKTSIWMDRHMRGARVMVPGSTSYFFNIFTDTPQLGGGFEQGDPNWENRVALYVIYSGENAGSLDGEIATLWLKAFGVRAVAVGGPHSGEHYKPFRNPQKFASLLPELHHEGDDSIYWIPTRSHSLAHVLQAEDVVKEPPIHGLDVEQVRRYVTALENPSAHDARFRWLRRSAARIEADLSKGHVLSVQVTYHPGWHAYLKEHPVPVRSDGLGLMVLEPACEGYCIIDLIYDGGLEMQLARLLSLAAGLGSLAWAIGTWWRNYHLGEAPGNDDV